MPRNDFQFSPGQVVDDRTVDFRALLDEHGFWFGRNGLGFCPFHDDKRGHHPSAKLYEDVDGQRLHCFSEGRQFRPTDFIRRVLGIEVIPASVAERAEPKRIDLSYLDGFKTGAMTIEDVCRALLTTPPKYLEEPADAQPA